MEELSEGEINRGLKLLNLEGMTSMGFFSITTSGFLAAFALALGANNLQIGILAAIPFIMQPLQIPVILLVEYLKRRKIIAVSSWFIAQALWFPMALIPVFISVPGAWAITGLLLLMAARGLFASITTCSWNSWIRDLIPPQILGRYFSKRLALATVITVVFSLGAGYFVDYWPRWFPDQNPVLGYSVAFLFGALFLGMASPIFMAFMPEPMMHVTGGERPSLRHLIAAPLQDRNYRQLMKFLLFWTFASNLAIPFFAVYMLRTLGYPIFTVIVLSVVSQLFNLLFLRVWGQFVDRFGSKVIVSLSASLFLVVIIGWVFTTLPDRHILTLPLLVVLHIFAGIATAGITLNVGMIGLKMAPQGEATSYLAGASLSTSLGTGIGPLVGGLLADFFASRTFTINFAWNGPAQVLQMPAVSIAGLDFLFVIAFFLGILTLHTLSKVQEEGEVNREIVLDELLSQGRATTRSVSTVPGLRFVTMFPFSYMRRVPGVDVALGVTAYQITDMAKMTAMAAVRGRMATNKLASSLETGVWKLMQNNKAVQANVADIARHTVRGVILALNENKENEEYLVNEAVHGILIAMKRAHANARETFRGAGYGIVQGAIETNTDPTTIAPRSLQSARMAARKLRQPSEQAASELALGMIDAASDMYPDIVPNLKEVLAAEIKNRDFLKSIGYESKKNGNR